MRRIEIIRGTEEVINAMTSTGIGDAAIGAIRGETKPEIQWKIYKDYIIAAEKFSPAARVIAKIIGIDFLEDPEFWAIPLDQKHVRTNEFWSLILAKDYLYRLINLLQSEALALKSHDEIQSHGKDMAILTLILFEQDHVSSRPERLVNVLEGANDLYTACATILDESPDTLSVVGCDSGSDKSFDFLGAAKVIENVKEILDGVWDRLVFYREKKLDARLDLIGKSLPIIEKISEMEAAHQLEPEKAELLRRNVFNGVNKMVESGASMQETQNHSFYEPRSLLTPVQKLLVGAPDDTVDENAPPTSPFPQHDGLTTESHNTFSPGEMERLRKILQGAEGDPDSVPNKDSPE